VLFVILRWQRYRPQLWLVAVTALLVVAPWGVTILARGQIHYWLNAAHRTGSYSEGLLWLLIEPTEEHALFVWIIAGALGCLMCLSRRQYLLPAWLLGVFLLHPRWPPSQACVPLALTAAVGLAQGLLPFLRATFIPRAVAPGSAAPSAPWPRRWVVLYGLALVLALEMGSAIVTARPYLTSISRGDRAAMAWVRANVPAEARFAVIDEGKETDQVAEWFPALAKRTSVATDQGYEWLGVWPERVRSGKQLVRCLDSDVSCLDTWQAAYGANLDYVYLSAATRTATSPQPQLSALRALLEASTRYQKVYDSDGVFVYQQVQP
jgi:hypothetical protein